MYQMKFYRNTETHTHKQTKTKKQKAHLARHVSICFVGLISVSIFNGVTRFYLILF